jgi:DNA-binding transcriptional LysR family regulator
MPDRFAATLRRLSLRQLRTFATLARTGTLTAAAQELGLTPPAVLHQIRELEGNLGLPLLDRTHRRLSPTEAGREVLAAIAEIDAVLADCLARLAILQGGGEGHVAIGVVSTAKYFAPRLLAAFRRLHPTIDLALSVGNREHIIAALESYEIDIAVMGRPPEHVPVVAAAFGPHPHLIIAPPDHPLAGGPALTPRDLLDETFLLREKGSGTRALLGTLFGMSGFVPPKSIEFGSNETIKQAVMAGLGIALISAHTIAAEYAEGRLALLPVEGLPLWRQWFAVRRREKRLSPAARTLWDFIQSEGESFLPRLDLSPLPAALA